MTSLTPVTRKQFSAAAVPALFWSVVAYALIFAGGILFSAHMRLRIAIGAQLGDGYEAVPPLLFGFILSGAVIAAAVRSQLHRLPAKRANMLAALAGIATTAVATVVLAPDVSLLQVGYFVGGSFIIAAIVLVLTPSRRPLHASLANLWEHRALLRLWVRYNVTSRYSQTILGILWIVLLPVATSILLTFVFSFVLEAADVGHAPFISFFLSGLTFWALFTQGMLNGSVSIVSSLGLINQIYFPREILVVVKLGEALVDLTFVFAVTLVINLIAGVFPNLNFVYLPVLLLIQMSITLGLMFFASYLTVLIRDLQPLITVFIQLLFYLTPLMYPIDIMPHDLAEIVKFLNPLAALINGYRDVMVYNRPPDFESLYFAIVLAGILLYSGYMFFTANERKLADFR